MSAHAKVADRSPFSGNFVSLIFPCGTKNVTACRFLIRIIRTTLNVDVEEEGAAADFVSMAADTQLRPFNKEAPEYGADGHLFSVELEHNGFFCGKGAPLTYIQPTIAYIDYCNTETWSLLWIEDILQQLGYKKDGKLHVYWGWSPPGKEICEGLVCIERDANIVEMIKAAENHKTLVLLVDHTNFLKKLREEAITNGCPPLSSSPRKLPSTSADEGTSNREGLLKQVSKREF